MPRTKKATESTEEKAPLVPAPDKAAPAPKRGRKPKAEAPAEKTEKIVLQYNSSEWDLAELKEKVVAAYVAEGHRRGRIHDLELYVKPEEGKIYYVINGKTSGSVDI